MERHTSQVARTEDAGYLPDHGRLQALRETLLHHQGREDVRPREAEAGLREDADVAWPSPLDETTVKAAAEDP